MQDGRSCLNWQRNYNPFRYRSYYYDVETGLYYLQTRYYDPEVGRFINSDAHEYLGNGAELSNYNLFAYCGNNPVLGYDPEGTFFWHIVAGAIIGAVVEVATTVISGVISEDGVSTTDILIAGISGAVSGVLFSCGIVPAKVEPLVDATISGLTTFTQMCFDEEEQSFSEGLKQVSDSMLFSLAWSWLTGPSNGDEMMDLHHTSQTAKKSLKNGAKKMGKEAAKKLKRIAKEYGKTVKKNLRDDLVSAINDIISSASWELIKKSLGLD